MQWAGINTVWHLRTMQVAASCWLQTQKPRFNILSLLTATMLRSRVLAYVASQLAAHAVTQGDGVRAIALVGPYIDRAARSENAVLLSTLLLFRAEALDLSERSAEARTVRLDSLGWARYGFGTDRAVWAKLREISSLSPLKKAVFNIVRLKTYDRNRSSIYWRNCRWHHCQTSRWK
jgi:hypothetical protein